MYYYYYYYYCYYYLCQTRQEELRVLRLKQREEYMQSTDPQCYQHIATDEDEETDEGLESKQLISNQDQAGGNYLNKQRLSIEPDMRVS